MKFFSNKKKALKLITSIVILFLLVGGLIFGLGKGPYQAAVEPNNFSYIKTYASIFGSANADQAAWIKAHFDMSAGNQKITNDSLQYVSWSDLTQTQTEYNETYNKFNAAGLDFDGAFLHYAEDTLIPTQTPSITQVEGTRRTVIEEDRLYNILVYSATNHTYTDVTRDAYGEIYDSNQSFPQYNYVPFGAKNNDILYLGQTTKFKEINFNLSQPAGSGWAGAWKYWDGSTWANLTLKNDGTNEMTQSGKIEFIPAANWRKSFMAGNKLYWVRLVCTAAGVVGPVAQATILQKPDYYQWTGSPGISGEKFAIKQVNGVDNFVIPGWNPLNDKNQDGFIDDSEFVNLTDPKATARFESQTRVPAWYFTNRWVMNLGSSVYQDYLTNKSQAEETAAGMDGLFVDNANGTLPDYFWGGGKYLEYSDPQNQYRQDAINSLKAIKQKVGPNLVIINGNDIPFSQPEIVGPVDGFLAEQMIRYLNSYKDTFNNLSAEITSIKSFAQSNKKVILHADANPDYWNNPQLKALDPLVARQRDNLYALARYYLVTNDNTYFDYQNSANYVLSPEVDWFKALEFDVGMPKSGLYVYQSNLNGILAKDFTNALVLLKPMSSSTEQNIGADTGVTLNLGDQYQPVNADGTLGPVTRQVQIKNYEGMILKKHVTRSILNTPTPTLSKISPSAAAPVASSTPISEITPVPVEEPTPSPTPILSPTSSPVSSATPTSSPYPGPSVIIPSPTPQITGSPEEMSQANKQESAKKGVSKTLIIISFVFLAVDIYLWLRKQKH